MLNSLYSFSALYSILFMDKYNLKLIIHEIGNINIDIIIREIGDINSKKTNVNPTPNIPTIFFTLNLSNVIFNLFMG